MYTVSVFITDQFRVAYGSNVGDPLTCANDLILDDIYIATQDIQNQTLHLERQTDGYFCKSNATDDRVMQRIYLDCHVTLMASDGTLIEGFVLVETNDLGDISQIYLTAQGQIVPKLDYTLIRIDHTALEAKFALMGCASFVKGTRITIADGSLVPVEHLALGQMVLTRDHGPQPIRWIGSSTLRAIGPTAPIKISQGACRNLAELCVSPDLRMFVYQRDMGQTDTGHTDTGHTWVRARHMVNGDTVVPMEQGFFEYFQILFDRHQIIFAEGIATESMLLDHRTQSVLPQDDQAHIAPAPSAYAHVPEITPQRD